MSSLFVLNDTKVIPARVIFRKETGARIEIFLLEPELPSQVMDVVMSARHTCTWNCLIGNAKKWKIGTALSIVIGGAEITARRLDDNKVKFAWNTDDTWSELLAQLGKVPLPPYIERSANKNDETRYQTVYSKHEGAVAAPTAGLHFTDEVIKRLEKKHQLDYLTLHVSAGTFQPIKTNATNHPMHREQMLITKSNIENLLKNEQVIAIGTTSLRTIESLYWYGVRILNGLEEFFIPKLSPYVQHKNTPSKSQALQAVLDQMALNKTNSIIGYTEIFIFPSYDFRIVKGLITNFHMPGTTLMMLVAAFVGQDWKKVYSEAMANDYRFLSYGDSSYLQR
jgi:S-adenosylmethionine:tRNA ribosyltransferase-isomerase